MSLAARAAAAGLELPTARMGSRVAMAAIGVSAFASAALVLYATPFGPGTGWDQSMYVGSARNLLAGHGLSIPWGIDAGQPLTHFPPLFPLLLASFGLFGLDPLDGARFLNAVLRGVNLMLLVLLVARLESGVWLGALLSGGLFFTSVHMASLHGQAWSEPLFLPLCFGSLFAVSEYLRAPRSQWLLASAALAAAAVLTRYVGLALVLTGALLIASRGRAGWRDLLIFSGIALGPLAAWVARNAIVAEPALGHRTLAWHPIGLAQLGQLAYTLFDWFIPNQVAARLVSSSGVFTPLGVVALAVLAGGALALARRAQPQAPHPMVGRTLPVFVGAYLAVVFVAASAFDHRIQIDSRTLSPIFVALVGAGGVAVARAPSHARTAVIGVAALLVVVSGLRLAATVQRAHAEGISYSSTKYLASVVTDRVRQLPVDAAIYSNAPDAVYLLSRRQAFALPDATTIGATTAVLQQQLQHQTPVYVAHYSDSDIAYRQLDPALLERESGLTLELRDADATGRLFELRR